MDGARDSPSLRISEFNRLQLVAGGAPPPHSSFARPCLHFFLPSFLPACLPAFRRSFQLSGLRRVLFCSFFQPRPTCSDRTLITRVNCAIANCVCISRNDRKHVATRLQQAINKLVMRWIMSVRRILHTSLFTSKFIWPKAFYDLSMWRIKLVTIAVLGKFLAYDSRGRGTGRKDNGSGGGRVENERNRTALPADLQQTVMVRPSRRGASHVAVHYGFIYLLLSSPHLSRDYREDLLDITFNFKTLKQFRKK